MDTPILTSCGIFDYKNEDGSTRKELRLPKYVFDKKSLETYKGKPIIITHDAGLVNKNNVEEESIGTILSEGYRDGNDVRAEICIHDTNEMKRCGYKELSLGYSLDLIEEEGEYNGEHYDAIQTNISINHLALVANARAGEQARLNLDGKNNKTKILGGSEMAKRKKNYDEDKCFSDDKLAVALAKLVLEEDGAKPGLASADDDDEKQAMLAEGGQVEQEDDEEELEKNPQKNKEILESIKSRRDEEGDDFESPANLDDACEIIKKQNQDIDSLLNMIGGKEDKENKENEDDEDEEGLEENEDDDEIEEENKEEVVEGDDDEEEEKEAPFNADSIDYLVRARAAMNNLGERFNIDGLDKMTMKQAMRKVVRVATPNIRLDSDSELMGAFKVAVATLNARKSVNYQYGQIYSGTRADSGEKNSADAARQRMIKRRLNNK